MKKITLECNYCKKAYTIPFSVQKKRIKRGYKQNFCSWKCSGRSKRGFQKKILKCNQCKKTFKKRLTYYKNMLKHGQKRFFCSIECQKAWEKSKQITCECYTCKKIIKRKLSHYNRVKKHYCSIECRKKQKKVMCEVCKKILYRTPCFLRAKHIFCSTNCHGKWRSMNNLRENNPNWSGGTYKIYYGLNWDEQKALAKKRDNNLCQKCGAKATGRDLHVHHIIPFRVFDRENYKEANKLKNLITVCKTCHEEKEMGYKETLIPFLID